MSCYSNGRWASEPGVKDFSHLNRLWVAPSLLSIDFFQRLKQVEYELDHSPPSSAKTGMSGTGPTLPIHLPGVVLNKAQDEPYPYYKRSIF
jgi:hypothetical protein